VTNTALAYSLVVLMVPPLIESRRRFGAAAALQRVGGRSQTTTAGIGLVGGCVAGRAAATSGDKEKNVDRKREANIR
jgi:hypothetical protein